MSHITTIKTVLHNVEAIKTWAEKNGIQFVQNANVRYYGNAKKKCDYGLIFPECKYDIGISKEVDNTLSLHADWGYADFYSRFNVKVSKQIVEIISEGHNEEIFRASVKQKYRVRDKDIVQKINPVTQKKILEVRIQN